MDLARAPGREPTGAGQVQPLRICLPWGAVSRQWAKLMADLKRKGRAASVLDRMITATALKHALAGATRNVSYFEKTGVKVVDLFA